MSISKIKNSTPTNKIYSTTQTKILIEIEYQCKTIVMFIKKSNKYFVNCFITA